jgi:hypothetical protein
LISPRFCILIVELLQRERFHFPAGLVPRFQYSISSAIHMQGGRLWLGQLEYVAEEELQPALQE